VCVCVGRVFIRVIIGTFRPRYCNTRSGKVTRNLFDWARKARTSSCTGTRPTKITRTAKIFGSLYPSRPCRPCAFRADPDAIRVLRNTYHYPWPLPRALRRDRQFRYDSRVLLNNIHAPRASCRLFRRRPLVARLTSTGHVRATIFRRNWFGSRFDSANLFFGRRAYGTDRVR